MEQQFQLLDKYIIPDTKLVLWISWGPDSMYMFHIVKQYFKFRKLSTKNIIIAHFNHKSRKESDKEELFLKKYFKSYKFETKSYKGKTFNERDFRKARYEFFTDIINKNKPSILLLWHNLTDRIETSFLNMMRWCSLQWLLNMQEFESIKLFWRWFDILRPLLFLPKFEVQKLCDENKIPYFQDPTNLDISYSKRNFVRHNIILPIVDKSNKTNNWEINFFKSWENIYKQLSEKDFKQDINLIPIKSSPYWKSGRWYRADTKIKDIFWLTVLLKKLWIYQNITRNLLDEFYKFISTSTAWYKYLQWVYFFKSHSQLFLIKWKDDFWQKHIEEQKKITKLWEYKIWWFEINISDKGLEWWIIRFPKQWDKYRWKSLSKYLLNKKIPIFWRNFIPVIEKDWKIQKILDIDI